MSRESEDALSDIVDAARKAVTEANSGVLWRDQNPMMVKALADLQVALAHLDYVQHRVGRVQLAPDNGGGAS